MGFFILLTIGIVAFAIGSILGYYARQSIAKKDYRTIEAKLQKKIAKAKEDAEKIVSKAKEKSSRIIKKAQEETYKRRSELFRTEKLLLKRESILEKKISGFEEKEKSFNRRVEKLKKIKAALEELRKEALKNLEKISKISQKEAKKELFRNLEAENKREILERMCRLEEEGEERYRQRAKEILALAIQKYGLSQAQEISIATVSLPSDEIKGRIIGKEGRNIRTFEKLTGTELIVDETPEAVVISAFNPLRRQVAKIALEKLVSDGRIQPARIEEIVKKAEEQIKEQIKKAGEQAVYETGIISVEPQIVQLLGRLKFRTSYGQNVLLHSVEVSFLARALADEIGADAKVCRKAGLLHDIGKAVDHQIQGSHTDIGIKILEKFGVEEKVVEAMKSHHEEYPYGSLEAVIVQVADQISGARPGARKDTLENYLKRLEDLEQIAVSFKGVRKAWALQAGREVRVFVKPEEIDDYAAHKLSREIAKKIQEELRYPGEIKVTVIRETRVVEYAR